LLTTNADLNKSYTVSSGTGSIRAQLIHWYADTNRSDANIPHWHNSTDIYMRKSSNANLSSQWISLQHCWICLW